MACHSETRSMRMLCARAPPRAQYFKKPVAPRQHGITAAGMADRSHPTGHAEPTPSSATPRRRQLHGSTIPVCGAQSAWCRQPSAPAHVEVPCHHPAGIDEGKPGTTQDAAPSPLGCSPRVGGARLAIKSPRSGGGEIQEAGLKEGGGGGGGRFSWRTNIPVTRRAW
jgi:hypothetical protein